MGLSTKSIKTGGKLSIFSKELTFVVVKTTFVFEKEEKEEEVLQKKKSLVEVDFWKLHDCTGSYAHYVTESALALCRLMIND